MSISAVFLLIPLMTSLPLTTIAYNSLFDHRPVRLGMGAEDGGSEGGEMPIWQLDGRRHLGDGSDDIVTFLKHHKMMTSQNFQEFEKRGQNLKSMSFTERPITGSSLTPTIENRAEDFLWEFQEELRHRKHGLASAEWNFMTNLTNWNSDQLAEEQSSFSNWWKTKVQSLRRLRMETFSQPLNRQIRMALTVSITSNNETITKELSRLQTYLLDSYSDAVACLPGQRMKCLTLEPGLVELMATSRDPNLLKEAWLEWRHVTGEKTRSSYKALVTLLNTLARENGYTDYSQIEKEQAFFETQELESMQALLLKDVMPLYLELHAFVRRKLRDVYGGSVIGDDGTIPAHLLGNMWAQNWFEIYEIVTPYPDVHVFGDVEAALSSRSDVYSMFSLVEDFYKSLGLSPMTEAFWSKSVFTKARGRRMDCNARTFDMFSQGDFRIKMCAEPDFRSLLTMIHEMGHISYCMAYAHQPTVFRTGANLATHEAIGDMVQLSFLSSPTPLYDMAVGLEENDMNNGDDDDNNNDDDVDDDKEDTLKDRAEVVEENKKNYQRGGRINKNSEENRTMKIDNGDDENMLDNEEKSTVNRLMMLALKKVAFLPFGYLVDRWRYGVLAGDILPGEYNKKWWQLRLRYQGIQSPSPRSESDFDPGAKYHVIANSMYSGYFIAQFQQFQMFSALCKERELYSTKSPNRSDGRQAHSRLKKRQPLHNCNIFGSSRASHKFRKFLSYGSSIPWQEQLKELSGEETVTADAMLTYFQPLHQWLKRENAKYGETIGWKGAEINWRD